MKLRNKLILSCAALAAVATTAVSTTYAWYTSNQEVTADGIEASTASSSDALLLISTSGVANTWSSSVNLYMDLSGIVPVYRDGSGNVKKWAADSDAAATNATAAGIGTSTTATTAGDYISFSLYFKSGNGNPLDVSYKTFTLTNTTTSVQTKSVLTTTGLGNVGDTYSVNLLKALTMENVYSNTTEVTSGTTPAAHGTTTGTAAYRFDGLVSTTDYNDNVGSTSVNAHQYYNSVKNLPSGEAGQATYKPAIETTADGSISYRTGSTENDVYSAGTDSRTNVTGVASFSDFNTGNFTIGGTAGTESSNILRVDYIIYLDGWDFHCFDACQGQTFTLAMTFKSTTGTIE